MDEKSYDLSMAKIRRSMAINEEIASLEEVLKDSIPLLTLGETKCNVSVFISFSSYRKAAVAEICDEAIAATCRDWITQKIAQLRSEYAAL